LVGAGVSRDAIRIGEERDYVTAVRSEMQNELNRSASTHRAGALAVVLGAVIGALAG
jgi:hypothetical protein